VSARKKPAGPKRGTVVTIPITPENPHPISDAFATLSREPTVRWELTNETVGKAHRAGQDLEALGSLLDDAVSSGLGDFTWSECRDTAARIRVIVAGAHEALTRASEAAAVFETIAHLENDMPHASEHWQLEKGVAP
jgi:hypothetical protein